MIRRYLVVTTLLLTTGCAIGDKKTISTVQQKEPVISQSLAAQFSGKKYLKRKVAISRFTNETKYGQGFFVDKNNNRIGKQAMDILSAK